MDTAERNKLIGEWLNEGHTLSEVQKILQNEHGIKLTYMELRLLASELEVDWTKQDPDPVVVKDKPTEPEVLSPEEEATPAGGGKLRVEVSKLVRPGSMFSGTVTFKSGASGEWFVDQMGRLGLTPATGSAAPTQEDIQEFQVELQKMLQG